MAQGRLVPVCDHPEAEWIVPTARRMRSGGLIRAEVTVPRGRDHHTLEMIDRATRAQLRAASLCGTTQALVLLADDGRQPPRSDDDRAGLVPAGR